MATDALLSLQTQITSTATAHSAGKTLPKATMDGPLFVRIIYTAAQQASGSGVFTFGLSVSYDGGSTWNADYIAADKAVTLTASPQTGEFSIPFQLTQADLVKPSLATQPAPQIRADLVLSGSPVTPTITWGAEMQPARI